jgi:hypothetical protein
MKLRDENFRKGATSPGDEIRLMKLLASGPHALDSGGWQARAEDGFGILSTPAELGVDAADSTINQTIALRSNMLAPEDNRAHELEQFIEERRLKARAMIAKMREPDDA